MYYLRTLFFFILLALGAAPAFASAAELSFKIEPEFPVVGESFLVHVFLTTEGETINAIDGVIKVPADLVIERASTGGSALTLWPVSPRFVPSSSQIEFTGGVPEGVGPNATVKLFTVHALGRAPGGYVFSSRNARIYRADGQGTEVALPAANIRVTVGNTEGTQLAAERDRRDPTFVVAEVGQDPALFNGNYFVTFSATDDQSGVTLYEVKEGRFGSYLPAERYYVMHDQTLNTPVWVRATDASGNRATVRVVGNGSSVPIIIGGILVLLVLVFLWRRRSAGR